MIRNEKFEGERPLYRRSEIEIVDCKFENGESAIKEGKDLVSRRCNFNSKYPFWHCRHIEIEDSLFDEMGRAAVWYSSGISLKDSKVIAPKIFRDASDIKISRCKMNTNETLWDCNDIFIEDTDFFGDYLLFHSNNIFLNEFRLDGNYAFQHCRHLEIQNSTIRSKDAFWNSEDVTLRNCSIDGEYLGWYSKNLTLIDCEIRGTQPLSYAENVTLIGCTMIDTDLAFELSSVNVEVLSVIQSVKNPRSGMIKAEGISELIMEEEEVNPKDTTITYLKEKVGCNCHEV